MVLVIWKMENGFVKISLNECEEKQLFKVYWLLFFFCSKQRKDIFTNQFNYAKIK